MIFTAKFCSENLIGNYGDPSIDGRIILKVILEIEFQERREFEDSSIWVGSSDKLSEHSNESLIFQKKDKLLDPLSIYQLV
jgi:hypothetical protein